MTTKTIAPNRPKRGTRSPLPPHGTAARGVGRPGLGIPGCKCQPCRDAKNKADTLRLLLNASGRPVRIPAAPVAAHLRKLLEAGMGWARITRAAKASSCTVARILNGQELVRRSVAERLLAVQYRPAPGRYVEATGTRRRIQALIAIGHPIAGIAAEVGADQSVITDILNNQDRIRGITADRIAAGYDWLARRPPVTSRETAASACRNRALRNGWAPPAAWDDDTIDDPNAIPEWTGFCGSDRGWWTHRLEHIPVCEPCQAAHDQWVQDRKHLNNSDRYRELGRARAEASNRGAAIAEDARELLRLGADYETAAARIGITRNHLQQELLRNPETRKEAA